MSADWSLVQYCSNMHRYCSTQSTNHTNERKGHLNVIFCTSWVAVDCGTLEAPANGSVTVSGTTFTSTATYSCDSGYILHGNTTRICLETGLWSTSSPTCTGITLYSRILAHKPLITYTPEERIVYTSVCSAEL